MRRFATRSVEPVDTTGAGDAFNAAFLRALLRGSGVDDAARFAVGLATSLVATEPEGREALLSSLR